ncbi:hypothetical protein V2J09_000671 [Rumex salicifolius]
MASLSAMWRNSEYEFSVYVNSLLKASEWPILPALTQICELAENSAESRTTTMIFKFAISELRKIICVYLVHEESMQSMFFLSHTTRQAALSKLKYELKSSQTPYTNSEIMKKYSLESTRYEQTIQLPAAIER